MAKFSFTAITNQIGATQTPMEKRLDDLVFLASQRSVLDNETINFLNDKSFSVDTKIQAIEKILLGYKLKYIKSPIGGTGSFEVVETPTQNVSNSSNLNLSILTRNATKKFNEGVKQISEIEAIKVSKQMEAEKNKYNWVYYSLGAGALILLILIIRKK